MASNRAKPALWGFLAGGLILMGVGGYALVVLIFGSAASGTVGNCSKYETYGRATTDTNYTCSVVLTDGSMHTVTYIEKPHFESHVSLTMWNGSVVDKHDEKTKVWVYGPSGALVLVVCGLILLVIRHSDTKQSATTTSAGGQTRRSWAK